MVLDRKSGKPWEHPDRSKKRKFAGNRHTFENDKEYVSTSAKKIKNDKSFSVSEDPSVQYCLISFMSIFIPLAGLIKCKKCNGDITFQKGGERGLGFYLHVICLCGDKALNSCPLVNKAFEINRRLVFVMRLLGVGMAGINLFCSLMDICAGLSSDTYYAAVNNISIASKCVYDIVIRKACQEEQKCNEDAGNDRENLFVSGDGTWAKRGFSSLLGVCSLIGKYKKKILDISVRSSVCQACSIKKNDLSNNKIGPFDFELWSEEHKLECTANHEGSAGKMEVDGMLEMFKRSLEFHGVKYAYYIGDGDSKTFKHLTESRVYGDFEIKKLECVLHVGKRMYKRLKEAKKQFTQHQKEKKKQEIELANKKSAPEQKVPKKKVVALKKGIVQEKKPAKSKKKVEKSKPVQKFTDKLIREMSTFYSLSIQRHPDSIENMKKDILAGYYHRISTDEQPRHEFCDKSWCKYLKHDNKNEKFIHKPPLDPEAREFILPIFESLSSTELLTRCLGKNNQNSNESFNNCLWRLAPKNDFSGKKIIEIAAWISASVFNEGRETILKIMDTLGCKIGRYSVAYAQKMDEKRISRAEMRSSHESKEARLQRKKDKTLRNELFEESEGLLYGPGIDEEW